MILQAVWGGKHPRNGQQQQKWSQPTVAGVHCKAEQTFPPRLDNSCRPACKTPMICRCVIPSQERENAWYPIRRRSITTQLLTGEDNTKQ